MSLDTQSPPCLLCGNRTFIKFAVPCDYRKPGKPANYRVYWCHECDYGFVWERPSWDEIAEAYVLEDYYTHHVSYAAKSDNGASFLDRIRFHISWRLDSGEPLAPAEIGELLDGPGLSICEIGCGNGSNLAKFQAAGFSVSGIEPDPLAREAAKNVTDQIFDGTAEQLPEKIADRKYDVVLMSHVLEHCLDPDAALNNARTILKDGGVYLAETPNCRSLGFREYLGEWPWSDVPRHLNFFTPSSLSKMIKNHNFNVAYIKFSGFCRQFSNAWINSEAEIWTAFSQFDSLNGLRPRFKSRAWRLLLRSIFASRQSKYDSVRVVGVKR